MALLLVCGASTSHCARPERTAPPATARIDNGEEDAQPPQQCFIDGTVDATPPTLAEDEPGLPQLLQVM